MTQTLNQLALVFPGQGSQSIGMIADFAKDFPQIKQTFSEASDSLGYDLWELTQQGPAEKLNQTQYTQPALLAADIALWRCWQAESELMPSVVAGHSLGEYSALVCANALSFTDAIALVAKRGAYMQHAVAEGEGGMAAIIGLDDSIIEDICNTALQDGQVLSPANYNAIGQTVIAGHAAAIDRAILLAKQQGAKIAKRIAVSVPSHCSLMNTAADQLAGDLQQTSIAAPTVSVMQNFDAAVHQDVGQIRQALVQQLTCPVRWVDTIRNIAQQGIKVVVECGPGKVLTGLNKRIDKTLTTYPLTDLTHFNAALIAIRGVTVCQQ